MGYGEALCRLLWPLRVYDMQNGRFQLAELQAAGTAMDAAETELESGIAESSVLTASAAGLETWESLLALLPGTASLEERRALCAELLRIGGASFTPADIRRLMLHWGVDVTLTEDGSQHIGVHFGGLRGIPENFERIQDVLERVLPCQLQIDYHFIFLIWDEFELLTWAQANAMSWNELEVWDPEGE